MKEEQRDLQVELKKFIAGASQSTKSSPIELTKTALYLLKYLPSARDAVLEYFNGLFDISLERHIALVNFNDRHCLFLTHYMSHPFNCTDTYVYPRAVSVTFYKRFEVHFHFE